MAAEAEPATMTVAVRCLGSAERAAGARSVEVTVSVTATVADVVSALESHPVSGAGVAPLLPQCAVAVGDEIVDRTARVAPAADVALLPPVAGG